MGVTVVDILIPSGGIIPVHRELHKSPLLTGYGLTNTGPYPRVLQLYIIRCSGLLPSKEVLMSTARRVLSSPKVRCQHQTLCQASRPIIKAATRHPDVIQVVTGDYVHIGARRPRLEISPVPVGLEVLVRGPSAMIRLFVHTKNPVVVETAIKQAWAY